MKTSKKIISMLLCVVMVLSTFAGLGLVLDDFKADAANITLGGITQQRVVGTDGSYSSTYAGYQDRFFTGKETNWPTNFVIPGLASTDDYTPQGLTYWEAKDWILISAYDASGNGKNSVIYALNASTTKFVALFNIYNPDGSVNKSHGGGIAASEYNFYFADTGSKISYVPLSEMDVAEGTVKDITLRGSIDCGGELMGDGQSASVSTSYCCYEEGVLWTGNFYFSGDDSYKQAWHSSYPSTLMGYRLKGNSSAEEWANLQNTNVINSLNNSESEVSVTNGSATMKYTSVFDEEGYVDINGSISGTTAGTTIGEITSSFASFNLTEGKNYTIEYTSTNNRTDMYMFHSYTYETTDAEGNVVTATASAHCNVKQATTSKITPLADGSYHYEMTFTAGLKPTGADSTWPATQSTNGSFSGVYTIRFDQDSITSDESFKISDLKIYETDIITDISEHDGKDRAGNPTYVVPFNDDLDRLQYAMVYKGKIYLSRSWSRTESTNHIRELCIGDFDINAPGTVSLKVNGRTRTANVVEYDSVTKYGGGSSNSKRTEMFYMSEGICVINDYIYMFAESAAWNYNGKGTVCPEPIDVLWKIDQYAIMGEPRSYDDDSATHYEKVLDISQISSQDDYLIVYESELKDPITQKKILYAIDSYGGYGTNYLPKGTQSTGNTEANTGLSMGIIGYPISDYSTDGVKLYVDEEVDTKKSIHWSIKGINDATGTAFRIENQDEYYYNNPYLYFGSKLIAMCDDSKTNLAYLNMEQYGGEYSGDFRFFYHNTNSADNPYYYLWCNDGSDQELMDIYTNYYSNHGKTAYTPVFDGLEELAGTFHMDAEYTSTSSGNLKKESLGIDPQLIHIYKRVVDPYSSTYTSRIYTDLDAELQADGTYNITMETYATSPVQYQTMNYDRPTDFIFVLDGSSSMTNNNDATGYGFWDKDLGIGTGVSITNLSGMSAGDLCESDGSNWKQNATGASGGYFIRLDDGTYCQLYVDARTGERTGSVFNRSWTTYIKIYYTYNGVKYYYQKNTGTFTTTETEISSGSHSSTDSRMEHLKDDDCDDGHFNIPHYKWASDISRLDAMKSAVTDLIYKIEDESQRTGLNHRIAITEFGSDGNDDVPWHNTGMYTNSSTSMISYSSVSTENYKNAFHNSNNNTQVMNAINIIKAMRTDTADGDTYSNYGFEMAKHIMENSGSEYLVGGDRSCAVIFITDGVPALGANDSDTNRNACANSAIGEANAIKSTMGGYVYSIQISDNSSTYGNMTKYLEYTSSLYVESTSLDYSGERNATDIAFKVDIPTGSDFDLTKITVDLFNSINSNSRNALSRCDSGTILREQLTSAFIIPDNAVMTTQFAKASYDGLGRLQFDDPVDATGVTTTFDRTSKTITATGYDYSTHYVSEGNQNNAKKLIINISGVLADENAGVQNTSINNTTTTAIYQNSLSDSQPVKYFPTAYFTIPEYTYALDYDMSFRDTDINGTPVAVSTTLSKQNPSSYNTSIDTDMIGLDIENNDNLIYTLKEGADGTEDYSRGYILINRPDGTYDWFRINIVPASNILFNDDAISLADASSTNKWATIGTPDTTTTLSVADKDIYGYDSNIANKGITDFSKGSHIEATVSSSNKKTNKAVFNYTGSGFDLMGACGPDTGIQVITVKNNRTGAIKAFVVDTYYNDTNYGTLNQVPVFSFEGDHDTYTVEVTAAYLSNAGALQTQAIEETAVEGTDLVATTATLDITSADSIFAELGMDELIGTETELIWFDENSVLNGGSGAEGSLSTQAGATELKNYIDGYRVYNIIDPLTEEGNTLIQEYYNEYEQNAKYVNIMDSLSVSDGFFAYVEGSTDSSKSWTIADYKAEKSSFPKDEAYLEPGTNGITFSFEADETYRIMLGMRAASNNAVNVKVNENLITVKSSTSMFYDITQFANNNGDGTYTVTIKVQDGGLLAIDKLKLTRTTLIATSISDMPMVTMLMTAAADPVNANGVEATAPLSKYPDYFVIPGTLSNEIVDPVGSDPVFVPGHAGVDISDSDDTAEPSELEQFFAKLASFFEKVIAFLKDTFSVIINTFIKF